MGTRTTYLGIYQPGDNEIFDEQLNDNANSGLIDAGVLVEHNGWTAHAARVDNPHATTAAQVGALANLGTLSSIQFGTDAARPGTGAVTAYYVATDTGRWYQGTGIGWALLAMAQTTLVAMVNLSGGALVTGDLVVADQATPATANGVNVSNAQDDPHVAGVVIVGGANLATVMVAIAGYVGQVNVNATGVTKGQFLRQSTTLKQAEGTPTTTGGSFGIALSAQGAGTSVSALLKGGGGGGTSNLLKYELSNFTGASFALPQTPAANGVVEVAVNGQVQQQGRDWTIAGSTISFPVGQWPTGLTNDDVNVIYLTAVAFNTGQFFQHQETTLGVGATVWNLSATPVGVPLVTRGGIVQYQSKGHYTIVGNVLTFAEPISSAEDGVVSADYYVASGGQGDAATLNGHASALVPTPSAIPVMDAVTGFQPTGSVGLLSLAREVPRPNYLQNGGFEQWHYGTGPFTASGTNFADQWQLQIGSGTASITRDSANADVGSQYCAAAVLAGITPGNWTGLNYIGFPNPLQVRSKTLTFAMRLKCNTPNAVRLRLNDGVTGALNSPYHSGGGAYETLILTYAVAAAPTQWIPQVQVDAACTVYLDNATLVPGGSAGDYVPAISIPDVISNERLAGDVARANLLTNSGFETWQRGLGPFATNNTFTADRWRLAISLSTASVVADSVNQDIGSKYALKMTYTHTGGGYAFVEQVIDPDLVKQLRGRQVALSIRCVTTASVVNASLITDGAAPLNVGVNSAGPLSTWETLRVSGFVPGDATTLTVRLTSGAATANIWWDNATLVVGTVATDYVPLHTVDDMTRCQRYYDLFCSPGLSDVVIEGIATAAGQSIRNTYAMRVHKAVNPTCTRVGTWNLVNTTTQPALIQATPYNSVWFITATAAGEFTAQNATAGNTITMEANP